MLPNCANTSNLSALHDFPCYTACMWTPMLLICIFGTNDCATPVAPTFATEAACRAALDFALAEMPLPENVVIVDAVCYNWSTSL